MLNKKVFQQDAYCPLTNHTCFDVTKVAGAGHWGLGVLCLMSRGKGVPGLDLSIDFNSYFSDLLDCKYHAIGENLECHIHVTNYQVEDRRRNIKEIFRFRFHFRSVLVGFNSGDKI